MRRYLIGAIIGFALSLPLTSHAAVENLIGRVVEGVFPVKVNGKEIEKQAIVIDGTSYLPVRAIGDALGLEVSFDADLGIELTQKAGAKMTIPEATDTFLQKPQEFAKVRTEIGDSLLKTNGGFEYIELDGNQYVSLAALSGPYSIEWKEPQAIFRQNGQEIAVTISNEYNTNIDGFWLAGTSFVKLSILGLKASVVRDTLVIERLNQ